MIRCRWTICALTLATALVAGTSRADLMGTGAGGSFEPYSPLSSTIRVDADRAITDITITLHDLHHATAGQLAIWLEGPDGSTVDLVRRLGKVDQSSYFGSLQDFDGTYSFHDTAIGNLWSVNDVILPSGEYVPTTSLGATTSLVDTWGGQKSAGDWTLNVMDQGLLTSGTLGSWTLNIAAVPEPANVVLFAMGGLLLIGYHWTSRRRP